MATRPLEGLLVVDLTRAVAGPFCTMLLGDLGARVLKIEEPGSGDETRQWGPPFVEGESAYFLGLNRNKESVALNLKDERGRDVLRGLARRADVLIENFRPGVAARLGIGPEELRARNPRLIYASVSGFGQDGPDRLKPGYDLIVQAMSGLMKISAHPDGPPVKVGFPIADILASLHVGMGILAALYERERTGVGRFLEVSLLEGLLASMCSATPSHLLTGSEPLAVGTAQANIVPYQMFACQDQPIVCGAPNERIWRRFCQGLERPEWIDDPRYRDNRARNRHRAELVSEIEAVLRSRPCAEWIRRLEEHEVPCAPVQSVGQVLASAVVAARGTVVEMEHARLGKMKLVGNPVRLEGALLSYTPPPELGEHTAAVLRELLDIDPPE